MLVAVTGASGFVGSCTVVSLKRAGHRVRALVRATSRRDHIESSVDEWRVGEQDDPQALAGLVAGVDSIIHTAVDWSALEQGPVPSFQRNLMGSLRLLEAARLSQVEQFIFVSSGAVYHEILPDRPLDENHPTWPDSIYGAYKAAVEPHLKAYHYAYGMNTSSWRPTAIYGIAPEVRESQWYDLVKTIKSGGRVATDRGGKIVHVQDVADALTLAVGNTAVAGQFYNLVDCYMYWQTAAELARDLLGSSQGVVEDHRGPGPRNQYDTRKAIEFFDRHGNHVALRRGTEGVRDYVRELLPLI
jgi:nucleoside-diphosphate-sugar epimerase